MTERRRVVVTGLGMATPLGLSVAESWQKALRGESGIRTLSYPEASSSPVQAVGEIRGTDWDRIRAAFPEAASQEGEKRTLCALWAAHAAVDDAALANSRTAKSRRGVMLAAGPPINRPEDINPWIDAHGGFDYRRFGREFEAVHRESIMRNNSHRPSALVAERLGLQGPNGTITTACASATQAIGLAFRAVQRGEADVMLGGGADSMINPIGLVFFVLLGAADTSRADPAGACKPFDRKRAGLVMGEGAGVVVLEELSQARERAAPIYAEVVGYGSSMDAYQVTAPEPRGMGASRSMEAALVDAALRPEAIDYVNAHGTGTKLNDLAETRAIRRTFGEHADRLAVNSSKPLTGHLLAAAGAPEFILTTLSVRDDLVHPTLNLKNPDPKCDLDYVTEGKRSMPVRVALSNSFGFGGQNATILVKKYQG